MSIEIKPLAEAELPKREISFWRMTGPSAILVGLSIGAGEMIVWPWITAQFGSTMMWAAALGLFLQVWVNLEIGRWAVVTGENPYTGFARIWGGYIHFFLFLGFIGVFLPGWARLSGAALKAVVYGPDGPGADWMWTAITFIAVAIVLFGPRTMYTAVERMVIFLVAMITIGLIIVAFQVGTMETVKEMGRGILNFGRIELNDNFTFARFFGAVVFAGAGGTGNLYYAFYLRDKNIGMGARIPKLLNPLREKKRSDIQTGFIYPDNPENAGRFKSWFRFVMLDQTMYFFLLNGITMFLFMFGALAVLYPKGIVPEEGRLIWDMGQILEESMGKTGRYMFLVIGMATMFSTQLVVVDGASRTWAYLFNTNYKFGQRLTQNQWYLPLAIFFMTVGTFSTWLLDLFDVTSLGFIFNSALIGGVAMAVYVPLLLVMNLKYLPKSARPKPLNIVMVSLAALVYISFTLYTIFDVIVN